VLGDVFSGPRGRKAHHPERVPALRPSKKGAPDRLCEQVALPKIGNKTHTGDLATDAQTGPEVLWTLGSPRPFATVTWSRSGDHYYFF
jgi:hypothetical protein